MKYLTAIALLTSFSAYTQTFSPSASGTSITSPSATVGPTNMGSGVGTAPTIGTPSAIGTNGAGTTLNPATPTSTFNNSPVDTGSIPNNNFNTAPTSVPSGQPGDTTLLNNSNNIPSNNPPMQAQEYNSFPGSSTTPSGGSSSFGSGSGVGTGMGSDLAPMNGTSPISNP